MKSAKAKHPKEAQTVRRLIQQNSWGLTSLQTCIQLVVFIALAELPAIRIHLKIYGLFLIVESPRALMLTPLPTSAGGIRR